jgi:hypothetical protein
VRPLLDLRAAVPVEDTHLLYTVRVPCAIICAIPRSSIVCGRRNGTRATRAPSPTRRAESPRPAAARLLLAHLQRVSEPRDRMVHYLRHIARYVPAAETEPLAGLVQRQVSSDLDLQLDLHEVARAGITERGETAPASMRAWSEALVAHYLDPAYGAGLKPADVSQRRQQAARIAGDLRLQSAEPGLLMLFGDAKSEAAARVAAGRALLAIDRSRHLALVGGALADAATPPAMREELVGALAAAAPEGLPPLVRALDAPRARLRERITYALAGSPAGRSFSSMPVRAGRLPAQALADPTLRERLVAGKPDAIRARWRSSRAPTRRSRRRAQAASTRSRRRFDARWLRRSGDRACSRQTAPPVTRCAARAARSVRSWMASATVLRRSAGEGACAESERRSGVPLRDRDHEERRRVHGTIPPRAGGEPRVRRPGREGGERAEVADRRAAHHAVHTDAEQLHGRHP